MVEPNHTLNQRREDRDQPTAIDLWKPALKFQADLVILWARSIQMMAQTVTNAAEKMKQN